VTIETAAAAAAALYIPPATMTPNTRIGESVRPEEMQTTTSFPVPLALIYESVSEIICHVFD
jgi:hypothetical protein